MVPPITETVVIVTVIAFTVMLTVVAYLIVLARLGKPLSINFSGYGVDLRVGHSVLIATSPTEKEAT